MADSVIFPSSHGYDLGSLVCCIGLLENGPNGKFKCSRLRRDCSCRPQAQYCECRPLMGTMHCVSLREETNANANADECACMNVYVFF